ncbi:unnamed protein product [Rhizophagus irregularis]|uniref:E2 ubiquitin-conjugating enzyme n=2 Tax=Rhizophagus irregularis TaxID=588596 RepID=A0A915ZD41_9GLOM|nr:unnamed protein product [Rhizophagus irregularis]CAB4422895.1 unnamed protein product [Rhizophagus irregularis]CAB4489986.1 unnamed protein product [Rhizophagus irregularis]CAB5190169.1 unnamed protein product [Rhizophagus irregularis]CAB5367844.1 unnamed protein product [Rhizophagus irregularis]
MASPATTLQSALLLQKQLKELSKHPVEGFSAGLVDNDNIYEWEIMIIGPPDTLYEGGFFKARMTFPKASNNRSDEFFDIADYPLMPPKLRFISEMWHPNVYPDGEVCISILHPPGEDKYGYEDAGERWMPVHTVETILLSVISMLSTPNDESPANIEAAKDWREDYPAFKKKVQRIVRRSADML